MQRIDNCKRDMKVIVSFTGGKDSVLALSLIQLLGRKDERINILPDPVKSGLQNGEHLEVKGLVTFAPSGRTCNWL